MEAVSKELLDDSIEMLLQNEKIINRLNRSKNSYRLNESLLDSSVTDLLPSTQKSQSNSDTPQITRTPNQTSTTDFSHIPKVSIENISSKLTLAKFKNLILTELGNDIKVIVQNEIKEHLKNETPMSDQSFTNFYLKEINSLKEELNKKEVLIKDLVETIKNLTTTSSKQQQPIRSQSFTSDSDENNNILTARPVNYKEINLDNTNMNTSTMNDDLRDKSTDIVPKKRNDNSILEQLEEVKKKKKNDYYAFKFSKNNKTSEEICETLTIQGHYPSNTTVIAGDSIINGIREERLSGKYGVVKVRNFPGATIEDMQHNLVPILERNPCRLILHVGTNNAESCTSREILDKLLKLKTFISEKCPQCHTIFSTPTIRLDKAKANLTVRQLTNHLLQLKIDMVDNRNITDRCIGRKGLHLNISGTTQLAKNFLNFMKKF